MSKSIKVWFYGSQLSVPTTSSPVLFSALSLSQVSVHLQEVSKIVAVLSLKMQLSSLNYIKSSTEHQLKDYKRKVLGNSEKIIIKN